MALLSQHMVQRVHHHDVQYVLLNVQCATECTVYCSTMVARPSRLLLGPPGPNNPVVMQDAVHRHTEQHDMVSGMYSSSSMTYVAAQGLVVP